MKIDYERLVRVRQELKLRQVDVSKVLGINRNLFSRKERGIVGISLKEAYLISKTYKMSIEELFFAK